MSALNELAVSVFSFGPGRIGASPWRARGSAGAAAAPCSPSRRA